MSGENTPWISRAFDRSHSDLWFDMAAFTFLETWCKDVFKHISDCTEKLAHGNNVRGRSSLPNRRLTCQQLLWVLAMFYLGDKMRKGLVILWHLFRLPSISLVLSGLPDAAKERRVYRTACLFSTCILWHVLLLALGRAALSGSVQGVFPQLVLVRELVLSRRIWPDSPMMMMYLTVLLLNLHTKTYRAL